MFYWDWNANSGDTGGIVDSTWTNILWVKIQWMIGAVGMSPWYLQTSSTPVRVLLIAPQLFLRSQKELCFLALMAWPSLI